MSNSATLEPRCRVCQNDAIRDRVNSLLSKGLSLAAVARSVTKPEEPISVDSVRRHAKRHFPIQHFTGAIYHEIVKRRALEQQINLEEGVRSAVTPLAYFEAVMQQAFESLADNQAEVSIQAGLIAATRLQEATARTSPSLEEQVNQARIELDQITRAVREIVPKDMWQLIVERLKEDNPPEYPSEASSSGQ